MNFRNWNDKAKSSSFSSSRKYAELKIRKNNLSHLFMTDRKSALFSYLPFPILTLYCFFTFLFKVSGFVYFEKVPRKLLIFFYKCGLIFLLVSEDLEWALLEELNFHQVHFVLSV